MLEFTKGRKRGPVTAAELMARLESDPDWVARRDERDRKWLAQVQENTRAAGPVLADLRRAGYQVNAVSDLFNFRYDYRTAVPILLRWLPLIQNRNIKEDIVRALTIKWAKPLAAPALIEGFRTAPPDDLHLKWAIGNALSVVADDLVFDEVVELLRDSSHQWSRQMLPIALQRMKNHGAVDVLMELLDEDKGRPDQEPGVLFSAIRALGNLRASKAKGKIETFLTHPQDILRQEAGKSLAKIKKAEQKAHDKKEKLTKKVTRRVRTI